MASEMKMMTGIRPLPMAAKLSVGNEIGLPFDHQRDRPRAATIMPSVAMKGGMRV